MHGEFLQDLAIVLIVAGVVTVLFHQLKQPVVLGYILAGLIVGPHTASIPLSVQDKHTVEIMSELGVILLMFSLGLHFSLRKLAQVGSTALIAASIEIFVMVLVGYLIGQAFGWGPMNSLFLGAILSISSTTIIIKALEELGLTKKPFADLVFGILIVEDILGIAMIALLSGVATTGSLKMGEVLWTLGKLGVFLATVLVAGLLVVPRLLRYVNGFKSGEMLLVTSLALCFGVSLLAMKLGYSVALGAFLIGAIVAEAREHGKIEKLVEPVRDMFSAVFFVSIGMLIDPSLLLKYAGPIIVITIACVLGKIATCSLGAFLAGRDAPTAARVGTTIAQIGEFSFIIAQLGRERQVTSEFLYPIAVTVSAITTLLTPYLIKNSDRLYGVFARVAPAGLLAQMDLYSRWASKKESSEGSRDYVRRQVRKWLLQIGLNGALATSLFVIAAALAQRVPREWPQLPAWTGGAKGGLWFAALLLSMPLIIVTLRKLRAVALVIAEASVPRSTNPDTTQATRAAVAGAIRVAGGAAVVLWILLLSSAIMPPWPILLVLAAAAVGIAVWRWKSFEQVYHIAQLSLRETLTQTHETPAAPEARAMPTVLHGAELETVEITEASPARGKLIRELQLRTKTGASAVAVERDGGSVVNPGPDDELLVGDKLLLLGSRPQLHAAHELIAPGPTREMIAAQ